MTDYDLDNDYDKYPKRVFEVISSETHYKDESEYFHYTDPNFFN